MKNVSRNKCLLCFRPVVNVDLMLESESETVIVRHSRNRRAVTNVTGTGTRTNEESKSSITDSSVSDTKNSITIRPSGKKKLSQAIKAVASETILAKRVGDRNRVDESVNKGIQGTISSCSSSLSSTQDSIHEAGTKQNDEEAETKTKGERTYKGSSSSKSATCLLLIFSLAMTIFSGKLCAIIFTSLWLYFLPRRQTRASGVDGEMRSIKRSIEIEKDSIDCEKVIMEGSKE